MEHNFNHGNATISDKITVCGELEHIYYHAKKSASVTIEDKELEGFFQTVAVMTKDFRRKYMKKHFPDCPDELWCLGKAAEIARQRIYESDDGDTEDLNDIDAIWSLIWGKITGKDLSGCSSCREDKEPEDDKPLGEDEAMALYIGEQNEILHKEIYRIYLGRIVYLDGDSIKYWAVGVKNDAGKSIAVLHYGSIAEILDEWMFESYPKMYEEDFKKFHETPIDAEKEP